MRHRSVFGLLLVGLFLAGLTTGCKKKVAIAPPPPPPAPPQEVAPPPAKAPTASLTAEPGTIERGQKATLRWATTDASEVTISGIGVVEAQGQSEVQPAESTTYELTAKGPGGTAAATASVSVTLPPPPPLPPLVETKSLADRVDGELADAYFDYDKSNIREDAQAALAKDANALRSILSDFPGAFIYIEGYCDERGSAEYNLALGDRRASSVSAFLEALGVDTTRLKTISYGKERPQCTESTEECWQKNRRVHFAANDAITEP